MFARHLKDAKANIATAKKRYPLPVINVIWKGANFESKDSRKDERKYRPLT